MRHPLGWIPLPARKPVFWAALVLTAACFAVFQAWLNPPLVTETAPQGIVSFELAGDAEQAFAVLASWDDAALLYAVFGLGFDFLFMPLYAAALSMGILLASTRRRGLWPPLGNALGWGAFAALLFDAVENIALFSIILNGGHVFAPQVAFWCASIKFGLIFLGLLYGLAGWLFPKK